MFANNSSMTAVTTRVKHLYAKYDTGKLNSKEFLGEIENVSTIVWLIIS